MKRFALGLALLALAACQPVKETSAPTPAPVETLTEVELLALTAKAKAIFADHEGIWDSEWVWVDADGNPRPTLVGVETFTTKLGGQHQELDSEIPALGVKSKAMLTFNPLEGKIVFVSMGPQGDYWIMKQDVETMTMRSEPHKNVDGTSTILQFDMIDNTKDRKVLEAKSSIDGGKTWTKLFTQTMVRRAP